MTGHCRLCAKEFHHIGDRSYCSVGCEVKWALGNEALDELGSLRAQLAAETAKREEAEAALAQAKEKEEGDWGHFRRERARFNAGYDEALEHMKGLMRVDFDAELAETRQRLDEYKREVERRDELLAGADEDLREARQRLEQVEGALREILVGKTQEDSRHPLGEYFGMASRFLNIARDALHAKTIAPIAGTIDGAASPGAGETAK